MQAIKAVVIIALLLGVGYLAAGPYITVTAIQRAAEARDERALAEHVDFVAVRKSVKAQLNAMVLRRMGAEENSLFAALGTALAPTMIGPVVDAYLTPDGLVAIMQGDLPGNGNSGEAAAEEPPFEGAKLRYESFDRFAVVTRDPERPIKFILERQGLDWRLTDVVLPLEQD